MATLPRHRFEVLAREIREEISRGDIVPGTLLPTERELQESHGVSRTTVRRALANLIETGWAESLPNRGVLAKLGSLPRPSTRIAFIDHIDLVHKSLFFRLHTLLEAEGFQLVHVDSRKIGTVGAIEEASGQDFAGAFVWPKMVFATKEEVSRIPKGFPLVMVDHAVDDISADVVMTHHEQGGKTATSHLIGLGRKRVAIAGFFTHHEDSQGRVRGFISAHDQAGRFVAARDLLFTSTSGAEFEDTACLSARLTQPDRPDAIFVSYDMSVPAIVEAVFDAGLRIPEDIAIVGFGNDLPFSIDGVGLTTVAMNWDRVAQALVETLMCRLSNPRAPYRRTLVPTRLIVRGSCGAPRETWAPDGYEISSITVTGRMPPPNPDRRPSQPTNSLPRSGKAGSG